MKIILITLLFCGSINSGFSQLTTKANVQTLENLKAPDFSNPEIKQYYSERTEWIKKVLTATRNKNEAGFLKLFSESKRFVGVDSSVKMQNKLWYNFPAERQKLNPWNKQANPLIFEIIQSDYYKKYSKENGKNK